MASVRGGGGDVTDNAGGAGGSYLDASLAGAGFLSGGDTGNKFVEIDTQEITAVTLRSQERLLSSACGGRVSDQLRGAPVLSLNGTDALSDPAVESACRS